MRLLRFARNDGSFATQLWGLAMLPLMVFLFSIDSVATFHFNDPNFKLDSTWNCKLPDNSVGKTVKEHLFTKAFCEEKTGISQIKKPGGFCSTVIICEKKKEKTQSGVLMCLRDPKTGCANLDLKRCFSSKDVDVDFASNANRPQSQNPLNKTAWNTDKSEILLYVKGYPRFISRIKGICDAPKGQSIRVSLCDGAAHTYHPKPPYKPKGKTIGVGCLGNPTTGMCPDVGKCFAEDTKRHYKVISHFPKSPPKPQAAEVSLPSLGKGSPKAGGVPRTQGKADSSKRKAHGKKK